MINRGSVLPNFLFLIESRYSPVLMEARFCSVSCYKLRPGTSRFLIINGGPVLPGFLLLMEARYSPISY